MDSEYKCTYCNQPCEVVHESGEFDANGPRGTIKGNMGDQELSDCCSEPVISVEVDEDVMEELCFD